MASPTLPPRILLVMPAQWPRALLRASLREVGYDGYWVFEVGWEQSRQSLEDWRFLMSRHG